MSKLTKQQVKHIFQQAILLAGFSMLAVAPMFYHQLQTLNSHRNIDFNQFYSSQLSLFFLLCFLSSLIGFFCQAKFKLRFGQVKQLKKWLSLGLGLGLVITPISYALVDHVLLTEHAELYLLSLPFAFAEMVGMSVSQEVILRFGLLSVLVYFLRLFRIRQSWFAILLIGLFASFNAHQFLQRYHIVENSEVAVMYWLLFFTFTFQVILSVIYLYFGLLASMAFHFAFNIRFVIYSVLFY